MAKVLWTLKTKVFLTVPRRECHLQCRYLNSDTGENMSQAMIGTWLSVQCEFRTKCTSVHSHGVVHKHSDYFKFLAIKRSINMIIFWTFSSVLNFSRKISAGYWTLSEMWLIIFVPFRKIHFLLYLNFCPFHNWRFRNPPFPSSYCLLCPIVLSLVLVSNAFSLFYLRCTIFAF